MKCSEVRREIPDYIFGKLPEPEHTAIGGHLATCPACKAEADELQTAFAGIAGEKPWEPDAAYWSTLLPRIHERIEKRRRRLIPAWVTRALMPAAAALALIIAVGRLLPTAPAGGPQDLSSVLRQTSADELQDFVDQHSVAGAIDVSDRATAADDRALLKGFISDESEGVIDESDQESVLDNMSDNDAEAVIAVLEKNAQSAN